jgi:hypothetical protein
MARGSPGYPPLEMRKFFATNYQYMVGALGRIMLHLPMGMVYRGGGWCLIMSTCEWGVLVWPCTYTVAPALSQVVFVGVRPARGVPTRVVVRASCACDDLPGGLYGQVAELENVEPKANFTRLINVGP